MRRAGQFRREQADDMHLGLAAIGGHLPHLRASALLSRQPGGESGDDVTQPAQLLLAGDMAARAAALAHGLHPAE